MSRRQTIAPGIYREGDRLIAVAAVGSARKGTLVRVPKIFPLGTAERTMEAWRLRTQGELMEQQPTRAARGTLAADVPTYLATLPEGAYQAAATRLLWHWSTSALGTMPRATIAHRDVVAQISRWTTAGVAASSCNHRLSQLRKLFHVLDGVDKASPADKVKFLAQPKYEPRSIPTRIVRLILDSLPDRGRAARGDERPDVSLTKIRLRVMAYTGIAPATLQRVRTKDLELGHARVYLRPRRKGKGASGAWVALLPPAVDALRAFVDAGLVGTVWSNSSVGKTWRVGIARATATAARLAADGDPSWRDELANLPARCKPYDLRHSFASQMYALTGDLRAVAELLQHSNLETTRHYTQGAVSVRVNKAIAEASKTYAAVETPPRASSPALRVVRRKSA